MMFMRRETFRRRMHIMERLEYPVLRLDEALRQLDQGTLPRGATVLTFDDGWYSFRRDAFSTLQTLGFPATVYVSSYYAEHETAAFNLLVEYLLWRTEKTTFELPGREASIAGPFDLTTGAHRTAAAAALITYGEQSCDAERRQALADDLARALGFDAEALGRERAFHLLNRHEITACAEAGIDIQLHGHRNYFSFDDEAAVAREIEDNRDALEPLALSSDLNHVCYPGGVYHPRQWPWLEAHGVRSAVTTQVGFNAKETPRFALRRCFDSDRHTDIEFEAELSGFLEMFRMIGWRKRRSVAVDYCASRLELTPPDRISNSSISASRSERRLRRKVASRRDLSVATALSDSGQLRKRG